MNAKSSKVVIEHARCAAQYLGVAIAAKYLRERGYSLDATLWILLGR